MGLAEETRSSSRILPLAVDERGRVAFDAVVRQGEKASRIVYASPGDIPKVTVATDGEDDTDDAAETTARTTTASQEMTNAGLSAVQPKNVPEHSRGPIFVRCRPSDSEERMVGVTAMQVDPLEPPKFKHKWVLHAAWSLRVTVMQSPPLSLSAKDQPDCKVPPCISNWKNPKGYTIPLDKRLTADGRGLHDLQINDAEQKAREAVQLRFKVQTELMLREKEKKEQVLRELAQKARFVRAGVALATTAGADDGEVEMHETMEEREASMARDLIREERRRQRESERETGSGGWRASNAAATSN